MILTLNRSTHSNHSEQDRGETHEDHVHVVENGISLYQANKINQKNVWTVELIDKLETLVNTHNAYIRNFRNIGISLDATMKVYEIRVDSVCSDVYRLRYGVGSNAKKGPNSTNEQNCNNDNKCDGSDLEDNPKKKKRRNKKRSTLNVNIVREHQMNAPLNVISLPDDLSYRLNTISSDTADANRLFTIVLPTRNALLQLNSNDKLLSNRVCDPVEFQYDDMYENDDYIILPGDFVIFDKQLPIRQTLSGYRIQQTPIDDDEPEDLSFVENDITQDYAFDINESDLPISDPQPMSLDALIAEQDQNNNIENGLECDDIENVDGLAVDNISRGEYSYRAITNIHNYWAGPSYWKLSMNRQSSRISQATVRTNHGRRAKKIPEKPTFTDSTDNSSSDSENFIKIKSKEAKKIRQVNYRRWFPEKLKLPERFDISKDLFEFYKFEPSFNTFRQRHSEPMPEVSEITSHDDGEDFFQVDFESPADENMFDFGTNGDANISQNYKEAPQAVENIQIAFDKRAKVVNIGRLNRATLASIDRQLVDTAANESAQNIDGAEPLEPGRATFSGVFKDHRENYRKFVKSKSDLSTGLILFSILNALNKERLRVNRQPDVDNDFEIVQLKKIAKLN